MTDIVGVLGPNLYGPFQVVSYLRLIHLNAATAVVLPFLNSRYKITLHYQFFVVRGPHLQRFWFFYIYFPFFFSDTSCFLSVPHSTMYSPFDWNPYQLFNLLILLVIQILPQLLYYFGVKDDKHSLDWSTIVVYTCEASCEASLSYKEEFAWIQVWLIYIYFAPGL